MWGEEMTDAMWIFCAGVFIGSALGPRVDRAADYLGYRLQQAIRRWWEGRKL